MARFRERWPRTAHSLETGRGVIYWGVLIVLGGLLATSNHIKHPPLALTIFRVALGLVSLLCFAALAVAGFYIAKDWLWCRRDDLRKWRQSPHRRRRKLRGGG
jgi:hypothetical protein